MRIRTGNQRIQKTGARFSVFPVLILLAVFLFSLCFKVSEPGMIPVQAMSNLWTAVRLKIAELLHQPMALDRFEIIREQDFYYETIRRLKNSFVTLLSGAAVCAGGAVFQTMFRNPLASPNILGISTGVNLGTILFLYLFPTTAMGMLEQRYLYCFISAGILVGITMLAGWAAGRKLGNFSVMDMLVVGAVISQFGSVVTMYLQFRLEEIDVNLLTSYQEISMGIYVLTDTKSILTFLLLMTVSMGPMYLLRYRLNATVLEDMDARSMGVSTNRLRTAGMLCGAVLAVTALVACGDMGILSMAVPPVVRYLCRGADFRKILYYSICAGSILLLLARSLCSMIFVAGMALPVNFAISVLVLPLFVFAMSRQRSVYA